MLNKAKGFIFLRKNSANFIKKYSIVIKNICCIIALLSLFSCTQQVGRPPDNTVPGKLDSVNFKRETSATIKEYNGLYDPSGHTFRSCDNDMIYYIEDSTGGIDSAIAKIDFSTVFMSMKGYEKHSADENLILVKELITVEQKSYKNTCIAYDFWCFGTEPFWQIEISEKENLIDFYNPMEQKMTHFEYTKPEIKNGITNYISSNKENKISIAIKKEKCNGAIDPQYNYSVQVALNDKKYAGCVSKPYFVKATAPIQ